jgi:hypothetical protein
VGAAERAVSAAEAGPRRRHLVGTAALPVAADHRGGPPLRRRHRRDDGTRRRLAVSPRRTVHRAGVGDRGAGRSAIQGQPAASGHARRMGRPAAIVRGLRSLLPLLHRRRQARSRRRVSCC